MTLEIGLKGKAAIAGLAAISMAVALVTRQAGMAAAFKDGIFFVIGGALLTVGFVLLRKKRTIENIPASRVRSVAMGLAELNGQVRQGAPLPAPITGVMCAYYRYTIEKWTGGKNKHWAVVEKGESVQPFWLEDETGRIQVNPVGADVILRYAHREIRRDGGMFSAKRRYTEYHLIEGQRIYVIGTVGHARDAARERREDLTDRLRELKRDPARMERFDTDRDGTISDAEWGGAVAAVKDEMLAADVAHPRDPGEDVVIGKGTTEDTFVLADRGEASVLRHLNMQVAVALLLGVMFTLIPAVSLLARAGALPRGLAINWNSTSVDLD